MAIMMKYYSYLLRLWQTENPQNQGWLASLEDPHTRQVMNFTSVEQLFEFIRAQINTQAEKPNDSSD
jgi:hypothetical protein